MLQVFAEAIPSPRRAQEEAARGRVVDVGAGSRHGHRVPHRRHRASVRPRGGKTFAGASHREAGVWARDGVRLGERRGRPPHAAPLQEARVAGRRAFPAVHVAELCAPTIAALRRPHGALPRAPEIFPAGHDPRQHRRRPAAGGGRRGRRR